MATLADVVRTARSFDGIRFHHQGRDVPPHPFPKLDCIGLVTKTAHALGVSTYDYTNYQRRADWFRFKSHFDENMDEIDRFRMKPGHVAIFKQDGHQCHCGIIGENRHGLTLIHAYLLRKKVVEEQFTGSEWERGGIITNVYQYRGLV